MTESNLPSDLAAFEAELQALPRVRMPSALRERVLEDLRAGLQSQGSGERPLSTLRSGYNGSARWWFAACAATVAMLWLNLSLVATRSVGQAWQQAEPLPTATSLADTQAALAALVPELSTADSQRYSITLYSGTQSTLLPVPGMTSSSHISTKAN